jgi:hypothetical protein
MGQADVKSQDVFRTVSSEHAALKELLGEARGLAVRSLAGQAGLDSELRRFGAEVARHVGEHVSFEEKQWVPLMTSQGHWNEVRARQLTEDHARHRAVLAVLNAEGLTDSGAFARAIIRLADLFAEETALEETWLGRGNP